MPNWHVHRLPINVNRCTLTIQYGSYFKLFPNSQRLTTAGDSACLIWQILFVFTQNALPDATLYGFPARRFLHVRQMCKPLYTMEYYTVITIIIIISI